MTSSDGGESPSPGPERPGADKTGPERPGADKTGPERPGADKAEPERPGANKAGPERPGADKAEPERPEAERPGARVSDRWAAWRAQVDLDEYDARWESLAASGQAPHGEADLIAWLVRERALTGRVLDAGCGTGRVAIELARRGFDVVGVDLDADMVAVARRKAPELTWLVADLATMRLDSRFPLVAMAGNVMVFARPADHRGIIETLAGHLEPNGLLVAGFSLEAGGLTLSTYDSLCAASGLELHDRWSTWDRQPFADTHDYHVSVHRRT
jgi:SAM-dependent methyltransferase